MISKLLAGAKMGSLPLLCAAMLSGCESSSGGVSAQVDDGESRHGSRSPQILSGRLLVTHQDEAAASVVDLHSAQVLEQFATIGVPTAVYASPGYRYGFVVQRDDNRVDAIDGGLWLRAHGDHHDDRVRAPMFMEFYLEASRPTHFARTAHQAVFFNDGSADAGTPASIGIYTEQDVASNGRGKTLRLGTHAHGAAQARGDYLLATVRDPAETSTTLPDRVALYHWHDDHFDQEMIFDETCPGLHGSAQNRDYIAFGCTDGVLLIQQSGSTFTASKVPNPGTFAENHRIGTLVAHPHAAVFVGVAANRQFYQVDPAGDSVTLIEWSAEADAQAAGFGFAEQGEVFVILDTRGAVTVLDAEGNWQLRDWRAGVADAETPMAEEGRYDLAISQSGYEVFVMDRVDQAITALNLETQQLSRIELDFVPHRMVWLGVAEGSADHDRHDHGSGDRDQDHHDAEHDHQDEAGEAQVEAL